MCHCFSSPLTHSRKGVTISHMPNRLPTLYTVADVAAMLNRTPRALHQQRYLDQHSPEHDRRGPRWRKIGGRLYVTESDLLKFLEGESTAAAS